MSYATAQQLEERYGTAMLVDLSDRAEPPAGTIDTTVIERALADAGAMIDGTIAARYALPLADTPATLRDAELAIAVYKLHRAVVAEKIRDDYRDALRLLSDIAAGRLRLDAGGAEPATAAGGSSRMTSDAPVFTPESLSGFTS